MHQLFYWVAQVLQRGAQQVIVNLEDFDGFHQLNADNAIFFKIINHKLNITIGFLNKFNS